MIRLWGTVSGAEVTQLTGYQGEVFALAFSPDKPLLATGQGDGGIRLWDLRTEQAERLLPGHRGRSPR
jgi:WD40 repeat protein